MKNFGLLVSVSGIALLAVAPAAHATSLTPASPVDNTGTTNYILVQSSSVTGDVTNDTSGVLNGSNSPVYAPDCCSGNYTYNLGVNDSRVTGNVNNFGMISQTTSSNNVAGILLGSNFNNESIGGSLTNSGSITVSQGGDYIATGILIDDSTTISGNLSNTGAISATTTLTGTSDTLSAYGVYNTGAVGGLSNSGSITATAYNNEYSNAYGIFNYSSITNDLSNGGTITSISGAGAALSNDFEENYAYGIENNGSIGGSLTNSGTINATAYTPLISGSYAEDYVYGIYNDNTIGGSLTNNGTINASGSNNYESYVYGIYNESAITGDLTNSGAINATTIAGSTAADDEGYTEDGNYGIYNHANVGGNLTNSGTIIVTSGLTADNTSYVYNDAYGLYNDETISGNLTNSGTINATVISNYEGYAYGIYQDGHVGGNFLNSGAITATTLGGGGTDNEAYGIINYSTITGNLTNSGTIAVTGTDGDGYGIYNDSAITGGLINTGTITANDGGYAIYNAGSALTITQSGTITGNVHLSGSGDTFNMTGGTMTGSIGGSGTDSANLTGGTLTLLGSQNITGITSYTQGASGNLVTQISTAGAPSINPGTVNLGGTLVIAPQGGGFLTEHTYTNVIDAGTTFSGTFSSVASASSDYTTSLVSTGANTYDVHVTWLGGTGSHVADSGASADVNNTSTLDYIALESGGTIGNITNAGSGIVNGSEVPYVEVTSGTVYASSLSVDGTAVSGDITNNGTVSYSTGANNAAGIMIANTTSVSGNITNTGTVTVAATNNTADINSVGLFIDSPASIAGTVDNTGTITTTTGNFYGSSSYGIENLGTIGTNLSNSTGTITATTGLDGYSYGLYNSGTVSGDLSNGGTITSNYVNGDAGISWYNYGIYNNGIVTGSITNGGTINVSSGYKAYGIYTNGGTIASLTNGGTINVNVDTTIGEYEAYAYGIYSQSAITGSLTNGGTITMNGTGGYENEMYGIYNADSIGVDLTNSGTITLTANSGYYPYNYGIYNTGAVAGNLTNGGAITVTTSSDSSYAGGFGIYNTNTITGTLTNSGTIAVTAGSDSYDSYSVGIDNAGTVTGGIVNGGTITATVGGNDGTAYGIYSSGPGNITNTGTITATAASGSTAYAVYDSHAGVTFNQNGGTVTGDVQLGGAGSTLNVNGGTINTTANNSSVDGNVTVGAGGTLNAGGTFGVSGTLANSGILSIANNKILTTDIYTGTAGTLTIGLGRSAGTLTAGELVASGNAINLGAETLNISVGGAQALVPGSTIIIANGNAGGTAPVAAVTTNSFIYDFTVAPTAGNNLTLTVSQSESLADATTNGNNESLAHILLSTLINSTNAGVNSIQNALATAPTKAAFNNLLTAVAPTVDGGANASALDVGGESQGIAESRIIALRDGDTTSGVAAGATSHGYSMWLEGYGQHANQDTVDSVSGYSANTFGGAVGADTTTLLDKAIVGVAINYGQSTIDSANANTTTTDMGNYGLNLYGSYDLGNRMFVNGQAGFAYNTINSTRHNSDLAGGSAVGNTSSDQYSAKLDLGRDYPQAGGLTLTPDISAAYTDIDTAGYTETGAAPLVVGGNSLNVLDLGIGGTASWKIQNDNGDIMKPSLHAGYAYDAIGDTVQTTSSFVGDPAATAFTTTGASPARSIFDAGAKLVYSTKANWDFSANYDLQIKQAYTSNTGELRATVHF